MTGTDRLGKLVPESKNPTPTGARASSPAGGGKPTRFPPAGFNTKEETLNQI